MSQPEVLDQNSPMVVTFMTTEHFVLQTAARREHRDRRPGRDREQSGTPRGSQGRYQCQPMAKHASMNAGAGHI